MALVCAKVPPIVAWGLICTGALLPSIGFGMLINMMLKKNMGVFFDWIHLFCVWRNVNHWDLTLVGIGIILLRYIWISKPQETFKCSDVEEDLDL